MFFFNIFFYMFFIILFLSIFSIFMKSNNNIDTLVAMELSLLSFLLNFTLLSFLNDTMLGIIMSLLMIVVAASETAMALIMVVTYYKMKGNITFYSLSLLKKIFSLYKVQLILFFVNSNLYTFYLK